VTGECTGGRPVLIGHSLGAAIALQVALDRPALPLGLVLFAPASTRGLDFVPADRFDQLVHPSRDQQRALLRAAFERVPNRRALAAMERTVLRAHPDHIEGAARSMRDFAVEERLASIQAPALVIAGDRDRHVPLRNHLATWRHLPRAGLHVFHGIGHVPFWEDPPASIALVRGFLDGLSRSGRGS
jgi:sigma-B regulation protein RsbQ